MKKRNLSIIFMLILITFFNSVNVYAEEGIKFNHNVKQVKINNVIITKDEYLKRSDEKNVLFNYLVPEEDKAISFSAAFNVASVLTRYTDLFDHLEIYISPYSMADSNAYAQPSVKKIAIAIHDIVGPQQSKIMFSESVVLHEIGHILQEELVKIYGKKLMDEYSSYYSEFNNQDYKRETIHNWSDDIDESFAEDFKVYAGKKFFDRKSEFKKTNQPYSKDIEAFFEKYFK